LSLSLEAWLRIKPSGKGVFHTRESINILECWTTADVLVILLLFIAHDGGSGLSRSFVLLFLPVSLATLIAGRFAAIHIALAADIHWPTRERVAMLGRGNSVTAWVDQCRVGWENAFHMVGVILPADSNMSAPQCPIPVLGTTSELGALINRERLERILVVDPPLEEGEAEHCARISKRMGVTLSHPIANDKDVRLELTAISGIRVLEVNPIQFTRTQESFKRALDVIASAILLLLFAPVLLAIALLVKLSSAGPILYAAPRVGKGGRHFTFLKFRSMYCGSEDRSGVKALNEQSGHIFKLRHDPRVTPLGRILRRYSLDELPQLINVLRGEMSIVGPRPLPAQDLDADGQSKALACWAEQRSQVLPGLTGLWQVEGRSDVPFEEMIRLDVEYIRNWSLSLDFRIVLRTPGVVLRGRGAY
jgi:exopolysaccharide biosynthesis polyprenyl glycosylphosphotransferase